MLRPNAAYRHIRRYRGSKTKRMTQSSIFDPRSAIYCLGAWPVARFSDLSVRKEKTEPCSIFIFLPVSESVELPPASELEVEVMAISPLAFAAAPFTV